ncbi:MAG: hypothetical protein ACXWJB_15655 [Limisphaerales bacterium]
MKQELTSRRGLAAAFMSALLCAVVLFSALMAVSPSLHQLLHQDANQASHECVVTLMQKQQVCGEAPAPLLIACAETISFYPHLRSITLVSQVDYSLAASRGPPVILL